jgi:hypothetical protein
VRDWYEQDLLLFVCLSVMSIDEASDERLGERKHEDTDVEVGVGSVNEDEEDDSALQRQPENKTTGRAIRISVGILLVAFVIFVIVDSLSNQYVRRGTMDFLDWVERNVVGGVFLFFIGMSLPSLA